MLRQMSSLMIKKLHYKPVIAREGNFTRSGLEVVDESEMFKGSENTLSMKQTYTHKFQCNYNLDRYPFDTQVFTS